MTDNQAKEPEQDGSQTGAAVSQKEPSLRDLVQALQDQARASEAIIQELAVIKGHIRWQKIWSTLRFFLIVVPIVLGLLYGLLYLPPEVKELLDYYRSLFRP